LPAGRRNLAASLAPEVFTFGHSPLELTKVCHDSSRQQDREEKRPGGRPSPLLLPYMSVVVDFLDDPALAGLDNIGPVITLDVAILTQPRRFPIHLVGE
jgi:hypothetical protein